MIRNTIVVHGLNQSGLGAPSLSVFPTSYSCAATESSQGFTLTVATNDQEWSYEISYTIWAIPWIEVSDASEEGDDTVTITCLENTGAERTGKVTFTSPYCKNVEVNITQAAA